FTVLALVTFEVQAELLNWCGGLLLESSPPLQETRCLWHRNKAHYRGWQRCGGACMTKAGPASSRDEEGIEHVGKVNNRQSRRRAETVSIRQHCKCVVRGVGTSVG